MPTTDRNYLAFAHKGIAYTTPYSQGFQASLSAQPTPLGESLGRSNQRGSKTSQACYGHPRRNLNLVRLFRFSFPLPVFGRLCFFSHPRGYKSTAPFAYCALPNPRVKCGGTPAPRDSKNPTILCHAVCSFFLLPPGPRFPAFSSSPDMILLGNLWSPMQSSAPTTTTSLCARLLRCSHIWFTGGRLCRRGCGCSATYTRLVGFEATSCGVLNGACCSGPSGRSMSRIRIEKPILPRTSSFGPSGTADLPLGGRTASACSA